MARVQVSTITVENTPSSDALLALYGSVGWTAYTREPDALLTALAGSSFAAGAWDGARLVGLVRVVSDGVTIAYVQDVLVHADVQRAGVGAALMRAVLDRYVDVRRFVLLTDDEPRQRAFYTSLGFTEAGATLRTFLR